MIKFHAALYPDTRNPVAPPLPIPGCFLWSPLQVLSAVRRAWLARGLLRAHLVQDKIVQADSGRRAVDHRRGVRRCMLDLGVISFLAHFSRISQLCVTPHMPMCSTWCPCSSDADGRVHSDGMPDSRLQGFETLAIHAGSRPDPTTGARSCGNFDMVFGPVSRISQLNHSAHAVRCALRGAHAHRVLIGACNPVPSDSHVSTSS